MNSSKSPEMGFFESINDWLQSHKPLPEDIRLGIWGASGSGKTTYLAMLYDALENSDYWQVSVNKEARKFISKNLEQILDDRMFPDPTETALTKVLPIYNYELKPRKSKASNQITLSFIDAPGMFYEKIEKRAKSKVENIKGDIIDYLMSCDGILFLIDPDERSEGEKSYSSLLRELFTEFQERAKDGYTNDSDGRIEQYIAFAVTKADKEEIWKLSLASDELFNKLMGERFKFSWLANYCKLEVDKLKRVIRGTNNRCDFFSISSIGRFKDTDGKWKEAIIYPDNSLSSKTEENVENKEEFTKGWSSDIESNNEEDPETSQSVSGYDDDEADVEESSNQDLSQINKIKKNVNFEPLNVIEPIEWLINSIRVLPPKRSNRMISTPSSEAKT